jgi:3-hydroxyacyl-[acyl-carrier-protein] dehydratase
MKLEGCFYKMLKQVQHDQSDSSSPQNGSRPDAVQHYEQPSLVKNEAQPSSVILNSFQDLCFRIRLLPDNEIFRAHFPEYPITPGAIQVRIATELLQKVFGTLSLRTISNLKFISPLFPNDEVTYSFTDIESSDGTISATLEISAPDGVRSTMNLEYAAS